MAFILVPGVALAAGISGSKHDFSATTGGAVKAGTETETCKFCHVAHGAVAGQPVLWSHNASAATTYGGWGSATTFAGTTLPTAAGSITPSAARCYACHDGTVAVGALTIGGTATTIAVTGAGEVDAAGKITNAFYQVNPTAMGGNHPVSIAYPGSAGTYNGTTSAASTSGYQAIQNTGCTSPSGVCVAGVNGGVINLIKSGTGTGVECTSCHDPHGTVGTAVRFLRVVNTGSALCSSCHIK